MEVEINERALVGAAKFIQGRKQALFFGVARSSPVEVEISTEYKLIQAINIASNILFIGLFLSCTDRIDNINVIFFH